MSKKDPDLDQGVVAKDFAAAVNMSAAELDRWLGTDESRSVGWHREGESEAVGHKEGKLTSEIKRKKEADLTDEDYLHMRKVIGYVHRHLAQGGPADDVEHSRWRYSLMNWGHDPLKGK